MICRATDRAYCICMGRHIVHRLYTVMSSIWHSLVVYVTENDYSQTFKLHNVMEKKIKFRRNALLRKTLVGGGKRSSGGRILSLE